MEPVAHFQESRRERVDIALKESGVVKIRIALLSTDKPAYTAGSSGTNLQIVGKIEQHVRCFLSATDNVEAGGNHMLTGSALRKFVFDGQPEKRPCFVGVDGRQLHAGRHLLDERSSCRDLVEEVKNGVRQ